MSSGLRAVLLGPEHTAMAPRNLFSLPPSFLAGSSVAQQSSTAPTDEL